MNARFFDSVSETFFEHYRNIFDELKLIIKKQNIPNTSKHKINSFIIQFLNRIMFIYFIQNAQLSVNSNYFLKSLIKTFIDEGGCNIYKNCLLPLFYSEDCHNKHSEMIKKIDSLVSKFGVLPLSKKNLFRKTYLDRLAILIPDSFVIKLIFEFFEQFNYSIFEIKESNQKNMITPEMISTVYEFFIAEGEKKRNGIFYTPKDEVELMCKLALVQLIENEKILSRSEVITLLFENKWEIFREEGRLNENLTNDPITRSKDQNQKLLNYISKIKIVDPSCGSGVFLLIMADILLNLRMKLGEHGKSTHELKKNILYENIYGVDIQDMAIHMCELRLWLWLIAENNNNPLNKEYNTSLFLPNLDLKLKVGDSLFGSIFDHETHQKGFNTFFKNTKYHEFRHQVNQLVHLKKRYFETETGVKSDIVKFEQSIIYHLSKSVSLEHASNLFFWEIDFIEVFEQNRGFDIIIGNPPYLRQEDIFSFGFREYSKKGENISYKNQLLAQMDKYWGREHFKTSRNDFYVYFYYLALHISKPRGVTVYITSNAWLDTQYGLKLQEFLLRNSLLSYVIQSETERTFNAAINTLITVLTYNFYKEKNKKDFYFKTRFITILKPLREVLTNYKVIRNLFILKEDVSTELYKVRSKKSIDLWKMANVTLNTNENEIYFNNNKYKNAKWGGALFKAPEIYFRIMDSLSIYPKLCDIANVHRGMTSNANDFFYIPNRHFRIKNQNNKFFLLESRKKPIKTFNVEKIFIKPLFKNIKGSNKISIDKKNIPKYVIIVPAEINVHRYQLNEYIMWGEEFGFQNRPALLSKRPWYSLPIREIPFLFWMKSYNKRFLCFENSANLVADQRVYEICISKEEKKTRMNVALFLNSVISAFEAEIEGVKNLGDGVLDTNVYWLKNLRIPLIKDWKCNRTSKALESYNIIKSRPINSIYEELGVQNLLNMKKKLSIDEIHPKNDRFAIDSLFTNILGLTNDDLFEIYFHFITLVSNRLRKSETR